MMTLFPVPVFFFTTEKYFRVSNLVFFCSVLFCFVLYCPRGYTSLPELIVLRFAPHVCGILNLLDFVAISVGSKKFLL